MIEPKLRFKADDGSQFPDWEEKKLGDITEEVARKDANSNADVRMISQGNGFILQSDKYSRENAGQSLKKYTLLKRDEFAYNHGASKVKPYGVCYRLCESDEARVPYVYHTFKLIDGDSAFWNYSLNTSCMDRQLKKMVSSGARMDGLLNIGYDAYMSVNIHVPSLPEQQKIAEFLSTIDKVIEKQKETVSAWEERKKGVMQKLFSQEVRFKADDGSDFPEWAEKKLNEIAVRVTRKNKDNVTDIPLTISSADGLIDQRNFFNKVVASKDMSGYFLLKNGEFAYNKSYSKGYNFGSIKRLDLYDEGALSTLYICFALNKNENSDFYQKYFDSLSWYPELQKICAEGARNHGLLNVPTNDFFQLKLCVPSSDKEQHKIADCLSSLDEVIEKQKETLVAWEELKKGLLQQMFV